MNRACFSKSTTKRKRSHERSELNLHESASWRTSIRPLKNNFVKKIILLAILFTFQKTFAQTITVPSNLKTLVEHSFQNYPRVASMTELVHLSEARVSLGRAGYLPIASGDFSYTRLYPTPTIGLPIGNNQELNVQFFPADNYNAQISVKQPILDLSVAAKVGKAKSDLATSSDNLESFKMQLAYQIAQIYYSIIFLNKSLVVQQDQLNLLKSNLQQIEVMVKNGDALKYDLLSTNVQYTNTENSFTDLQEQLQKQYNMLNMLTGKKGQNYITDSIDYHTFDQVADSILASAANRNPDLKIAKDKVDAANWDIIAANRSRLPTMNLQAAAGYKNGFIPDIGTIQFNYAVGVGITIPILPPSRPGIQKRIAEMNVNASKFDLNTQTLTLTKDLLNALGDVKKNEKKLTSADTLIQQAQTALEIANERYKNGVNTSLDLLTAQTNYQNALLSRLQFEYNLILSKMEVSRLAGNRWW